MTRCRAGEEPRSGSTARFCGEAHFWLSRPRNECDSALRDMGPDLMLQRGNTRAVNGDEL